MTLVCRQPKLLTPTAEETPGPGTYQIKGESKEVKPSASFVSRIGRDLLPMCENNVGPGSYEIERERVEGSAPQSIFKSKIERFAQPKVLDERPQENDLFADEQSKKTPVQKKIPGKLVTIKIRKQIQKELMPQLLPSIPSQECSYGYRYDSVGDKLVQNTNPKIIFAKSQKKGKQDFYFQRAGTKIGKGSKQTTLKSNVQRSSPQLKHQVDVPSAAHYHPNFNDLSQIVQKRKSSVVQERYEGSMSPKQQLKLRKLKKQFKDYFQGNIDLKALEEQRTQQLRQPIANLSKSQEKYQFFLSKENRFKQIINSQPGTYYNSQNITENTQNLNPKKKKKEPYGIGQQRFKQREKQNLGPGSYQIVPKEGCGVSLNFKQQRFKTLALIKKVPGPGAYDIESKHQVHKPVIPFNRFVCNNLKDRETNRYNSMESLYQQVGKQLNYRQKLERSVNVKKIFNIGSRKEKSRDSTAADLVKIRKILEDENNGKHSK